MYHYICNIINPSDVILNREPVFFEAGRNRVLFICNAINEEVKIVSMGAGKKKGFFKIATETYSSKIKIVYLQQWHITIFKKKLRHIFYGFFLLNYLIKNVKQNDKLILYNSPKGFFMIVPVLLFNLFRKTGYILELEELYSYKRGKHKLSFTERVSIKYASAYILVNQNMENFIDKNKPSLLNAGYFSIDKDAIVGIKKKDYTNLQMIYSGRLDEGSGIEVFLESLKFITSRCIVIITGRGALESIVNSFENRNPLVDFRYLGILNNMEYNQLLLNTQIAINPILAKNDFTDVSFPSKVLQYLAYGLPVVSSNIKALEVLNGLRKNIYFYNNDSPLQLAGQINSLLKGGFSNRLMIIEETKRYFDDSTIQLKEFISKI